MIKWGRESAWYTIEGGHRECRRCDTIDFCRCYWCDVCGDLTIGQIKGHGKTLQGQPGTIVYDCKDN